MGLFVSTRRRSTDGLAIDGLAIDGLAIDGLAIVAVVVLSIVANARAGDGVARAAEASASAPSLESGLPSDSVFLLHWKNGENNGFADTHLSRVRRSLRKSGFLERFISEYQSTLEADDRRGFDAQAKRWQTVLEEVPWWEMVSQEMALGARVGPGGRLEILALFRIGESTRDVALDALRNVMYAIAGVGSNLELEVGSRGGVSTAVLYNRFDYGEQVSISGWRDLVAVSTSASYLRKALHVLEGRGRDIGLVQQQSFRESAKTLASKVPPKKAAASTGRLEVWLSARPVFGGFELLDVLDSYHFEAVTTARQIGSHSTWTLTDRATSPLHQAVASQKDVRELAVRVPASARSFSVAAGTNPGRFYEACLEFLVLASGDPKFGEEIEREMSVFRVHLAKDVLKNLTGRRLSIDLAKTDAGEAEGQAFLFEVRDAAKATDALAKLAEDLREPLGRWNVTIEKQADDGTVSIQVPLLDGAAKLAVVDRFFVLATSKSALDVVRGKGERKKLEWLPPTGELDAFSEGPWSGQRESIAWVMRMSGLVGTLLSDDGGPGVLKPFLVAAPKLLPAVSAFDFLGGARSCTVRDGRVFYSSGRTLIHAIRDF